MKNNYAWSFLLTAGILLMVFGSFSLTSPLNAYVWMIRYTGFLLLSTAVLLAVFSCNIKVNTRERKWLLAESTLDFLFATSLLFNPFFSFIIFPFLIGPWMILKGLLKAIAGLTMMKSIPGMAFAILGGCLSVFFGLLILYNPLDKPEGITIFIGIFGLVMGSLYVFDAIRFRKMVATLDMIF